MTSEPMFPIPAGWHRTFVRVVELPWPHDGVGMEAVCRACGWTSPALRAFYESAWEDMQQHHESVRADEDFARFCEEVGD